MITWHHLTLAALAVGVPLAQAKLPPPSPEVAAKADEAKAKAAHGDKVAGYKLCLSMDRVAVHYLKTAGDAAMPPTPTPACTDPGLFVYTPEATVPAVSPAIEAVKSVTPPLEAAEAHSPAKTATAPPSGKATEAELAGRIKK